MTETEKPAHEIITDGGIECPNCGNWRMLHEFAGGIPEIEDCDCGDEAFDLWDDAEANR